MDCFIYLATLFSQPSACEILFPLCHFPTHLFLYHQCVLHFNFLNLCCLTCFLGFQAQSLEIVVPREEEKK